MEDLSVNMPKSTLNTCVAPDGRFVYGLHCPSFCVDNLRRTAGIRTIGRLSGGNPVENHENFPDGPVDVPAAGAVFEIRNPFPFRGVTYIKREWADRMAAHPAKISLPVPPVCSFTREIDEWFDGAGVDADKKKQIFKSLPEAVKLAIAANSTDYEDLVHLARLSAEFTGNDAAGDPGGVLFDGGAGGRPKPVIYDHALFETLANNPALPDAYKRAMVLVPGIQGDSGIVGEWGGAACDTHVYEYLRQNSYIPWGHYAANMADDAVRYDAALLTASDMRAMRHLYYQRTYVRLARKLGLTISSEKGPLAADQLEHLRMDVKKEVSRKGIAGAQALDRSLWGWNYGFDYAPSRYRLHASHQQIHQQFSMIPRFVPEAGGSCQLPAYACGDLIFDFIGNFRAETGVSFFDAYLRAISTNRRMDGRDDRPASLVVYEDDAVILFVPKAQTSQWELQLMTKVAVGNVLDADAVVRDSLDHGILYGIQALCGLGARMVTMIEFSSRFDSSAHDQRIIYSFLPRLPESPGAFSEAQLRWINGHYPEDFASACRSRRTDATAGTGCGM